MDVCSNADDLTNLAQFKHGQFCIYIYICFSAYYIIQINLIEQYLKILSCSVTVSAYTSKFCIQEGD